MIYIAGVTIRFISLSSKRFPSSCWLCWCWTRVPGEYGIQGHYWSGLVPLAGELDDGEVLAHDEPAHIPGTRLDCVVILNICGMIESAGVIIFHYHYIYICWQNMEARRSEITLLWRRERRGIDRSLLYLICMSYKVVEFVSVATTLPLPRSLQTLSCSSTSYILLLITGRERQV